ncbi:MAG: alkaline phytoceramidase [Crocinitomicaceae bacterium]|nr:alkaline phytoceramidase [Crocinitomicaceae bacterium]|tara:strand:- start:9892 stop:10656 length:765 start_codon:yes stop_codon:yes gene_type:complete
MKLFLNKVMKSKTQILGILISLLMVLGFILTDPISQQHRYHQFTYDTMLLGIPNFWNVITNIPFIVVGLIGARWVWKQHRNYRLRTLASWLFIGLIGIGIGSTYYHINPAIDTLFWDRLPMALVFSILLVVVVHNFVSKKLSRQIQWPVIICSLLSVIYWRVTESLGYGDLRPYILVQFIPMLLIPYFLWLNRYGKVRGWMLASLLTYILAKISEHFDAELFELTGFIAGHPIKHLLAAMAMIFIFKHFQKNAS